LLSLLIKHSYDMFCWEFSVLFMCLYVFECVFVFTFWRRRRKCKSSVCREIEVLNFFPLWACQVFGLLLFWSSVVAVVWSFEYNSFPATRRRRSCCCVRTLYTTTPLPLYFVCIYSFLAKYILFRGSRPVVLWRRQRNALSFTQL
jgi:hypothetical protein